MASSDIDEGDDEQASPEFKVAVGDRLRRLRVALGHESLRQFAKDTGVGENRLGNWENGVALVPAWYIERIRKSHGSRNVTHDWIYSGDPSGLEESIRKKLLKKA